MQGDASNLVHLGRIKKTLTSLKGSSSILSTLEERKNTHSETVFDAYRYVSGRPLTIQNHRVVIFFGEDGQWYILDPLDGEKTIVPQNFSQYLADDIDAAEWLFRFPGYSRSVIESKKLASVLPFLSPEVQIFFRQKHFFGLDPMYLGEQGG